MNARRIYNGNLTKVFQDSEGLAALGFFIEVLSPALLLIILKRIECLKRGGTEWRILGFVCATGGIRLSGPASELEESNISPCHHHREGCVSTAFLVHLHFFTSDFVDLHSVGVLILKRLTSSHKQTNIPKSVVSP